MKKLFLLAAAFILVGAIEGNSFEFAKKDFGPLKASEPYCKDRKAPYGDLLYDETNTAKQECLIGYRTKGKIIDMPDGSVKAIGTSVTVSSKKFEDFDVLKKNFLNPNSHRRNKNSEGMSVYRRESGIHEEAKWISGNYIIHIHKSGDPLPEVKEIFDYYLAHYPPTYTVNAEDVDPRKVQEYELELRMEIIENGERYRHMLKSKQDKLVGVISQCKYEAEIRCAAGLCEEALIKPKEETPPGQKHPIGCPIAMNFNQLERKKLWKKLEEKALASDRLDFDSRSWTCSFVGFQWYYVDVVHKLGFTKIEVKLMYESEAMKSFLPEDYKSLYPIVP